MLLARKSSFLQKDRTSRHLLSATKMQKSISVSSDSHQNQSADKELNDRIAERFFFKRTKGNHNLSVVSKSNTKMTMLQQLKSASARFDEVMKRKGLAKNPSFYLGPKKPSSSEDSKKFVTPPKCYVCENCNTKLLNVIAYLKHIRKHKVGIRCLGCHHGFNDIVQKRRHELRCPKKTKLRF